MKKCPRCNRTYGDESFSFCLEDGALLSAAYDRDATLVIPTAINSDSTITARVEPVLKPTSYGAKTKKGKPSQCDRATFLEQAAASLSTSEAHAVEEILDSALKLGYGVKWGKGKSCSYELSHTGRGLFWVNSKGELWLTGKAKGFVVQLVEGALEIEVKEYSDWFKIPIDWVPKCDKFLHVLATVATPNEDA